MPTFSARMRACRVRPACTHLPSACCAAPGTQQAAPMDERIRLARDLHDGVLQSLTGAALQLQTVGRLFAEDPQAARNRLQEIQNLLAEAQRELRFFIQRLTPRPPRS